MIHGVIQPIVGQGFINALTITHNTNTVNTLICNLWMLSVKKVLKYNMSVFIPALVSQGQGI